MDSLDSSDSVDPTPRLHRFDSYEQACREFELSIPDKLNIGAAICRRHSDAVTRIALVEVKPDAANTYTFGGLDYLSDKFAVALTERGISPGERVAIALPQGAASAVAQLAVLKAGATAVMVPAHIPGNLEETFGPAASRSLVTDVETYERLTAHSGFPAGFTVYLVGHRLPPGGYEDFWRLTNLSSSDFQPVETRAASPAFIFFEESAPGDPVVPVAYSHGSLIAQLAAFEMANEFELDDESMFWTPSAWWSSTTVLGMLYPAWWCGAGVVSLDRALPAGWLKVIDSYAVTNAFMSTEQLDLLCRGWSEPGPARLNLRTIVTSGPISAEMSRWCEQNLTSQINAIYGWPGALGCIATCRRWFETRPEWLGRTVPGRHLEIVDSEGRVAGSCWLGSIVVRRLDPSSAGAPSMRGGLAPGAGFELAPEDWIRTGARGLKDDWGQIWLTPDFP